MEGFSLKVAWRKAGLGFNEHLSSEDMAQALRIISGIAVVSQEKEETKS